MGLKNSEIKHLGAHIICSMKPLSLEVTEVWQHFRSGEPGETHICRVGKFHKRYVLLYQLVYWSQHVDCVPQKKYTMKIRYGIHDVDKQLIVSH